MEQNHESITKRIVHLNSLLTRSASDSKSDTGSFLISRETLIDALILLYDECNNDFLMKDSLIADFVQKYRSTILKLRDLNVGIGDFEVKKVISRGRFAEVIVAREKSSQNVCVLKKIRKSDILNDFERIYFENERNLLITASSDNEARKWVPQLYYSFQNMKYLYYVLEFCPGGNLCTMLEYYNKNVPEPMLGFYLAEMIQAIHAIHSIGFVHRDIRPANILIDKIGHLKLIDFGSSAKLSRHGQVNSKMVCSIPHYTAPEIYKFNESQSQSSKGYTASCDWWSLGIVLYELAYGTVPFTSDQVPKLHASSTKLQYPKQVKISQDLKNIISGLLQPAERRIGYEKLTNLDYFNDIAWSCLRERDPQFVPSLSSPDDTSYFTTFEVQRPTPKVEDYKLQRRFTGRNLPFLGFTYLGNDSTDLDDNSSSTSSYVITSFPASVSERRKTDNYSACKENDYGVTDIPRYSTGSLLDSRLPSECSDESYQSASVRLQNEVNQLHLFYNQKALIIEENLKNKFHDMYHCITEEQGKLFLDRQLLRKEFKEKEDKLMKENEDLKTLNKNLENELTVFKNKCSELEIQQDLVNQNLQEALEKSMKNEKLKKEAITKLNLEIQKLNKDLLEKSEKLKEAEEKMVNLSNQQAAKLAMLSKTRTTLRSKSSERDKFELENVTLKNQLAEANKKITKLTQDLEKKGKVKLDLEFKMTATDKSEGSDKGRGDSSRNTKASQSSKGEIEKSHQELEQRQKEIFELHEKLEKEKERNQKEIYDLTEKLNGELVLKRQEICDLQTVISHKQDCKQKEISELQDKLKKEREQNHKEIANLNEKLNQELERKKKEILDLQAKLNQKQDRKKQEIGDLQNEMSQELQRKQKEISDLQHRLSQKQDRKQKEISDLQDKLNQEQLRKQKEITDLQAKLNHEQLQKQKEITDLQNKLAQENKQIQKEISELQNKLSQEQKKKHKEIADLQEKLDKELGQKQKEVNELSEKLIQEQKRKQKEIAELQEKLEKQLDQKHREILNLQEKLSQEQKLKQKEIARLQDNLNKELDGKQKQIIDFQNQLTKMNEDLFNNLVTIEDLKTALEKENDDVKKYVDEISNLKKQLDEKCEQVTTFRTSLCQSDEEKERLESKIETLLNEVKNCNDIKLKEIEAARVDPNQVLKQFESTMREILNENLQKKENTIKTSELENMFKAMQKRVSLVCTSARVPKSSNLDPEERDIAVLQAQVERLESQLEKHRESAILQREAAAQAKKQLSAAEKELSNLKIDLRIAQREAKTAEEEIKKLQKAKFSCYRELKDEKENLETKLKEEQEKIQNLETTLDDLKKSLVSKEDVIKGKETELDVRISLIESLEKEFENVRNENNDLKKEKKKMELILKEKELEVKQYKSKISKMKEEIKQNKSDFSSVKEEEENWKTKCAALENTIASIKETCLMLDKQVETFENYNHELEEQVNNQTEEKLQLQTEVHGLTEELKSAKKMINEEKSLKILAENKIRLLESNLEKKNEALKALEEDNELKAEHINNLEDQMRQLEEYIATAKESMEKSAEYVSLMEKEIVALKKERSQHLTNIHQLTKEKTELINELEEATSDLNDLQKANGDLQSVLAQVEAYHEIHHLKDNTTLQQHSKLIDFLLQSKFHDSTKQKRTLADKLFRTKGKENLNPKELENLLYVERNKSKGLAEQLYQARIELMMLRGENVSKCSSPKMISDCESNFSRTPSSKNQLTSISNFSELEIPTSRIKHNIPHKFETKRCTKTGCKCSVCSNLISFGHNMSCCKECHIWSHVQCTKKIGPTCGLPKALVEQLAAMNKNQIQCTSSESSLKSDIEGNINVLRDGKWEKMHICIESKNLIFYDRALTSETPTMKIPVSSIKSFVDDVDTTSILTLSSSYDGEANCVLKIIYEEGQTQKSLYMRASTEDDKANWLNVLKRNITPKQITFKLEPQECFKGNVVCSFDQSDRLKINHMIQISPEVCLVAADEGLYSLRVNIGPENNTPSKPVKISGTTNVSKIRILTKLRLALFICDKENLLKKCDLRMLVSNAEAAECSSPFVAVDDASTGIELRNCSLLEVSRCNSLISFTTDKHIMILEWKDTGFDVLKFKKKVAQVKCLLFTPMNLFYNTSNEFCRIDLQNMNENRLNVFKCKNETDTKSFQPEAMIKINSDLYLVCDKSFGIFVDANGKRIKSAETMKWPLALKRIVYNKPFLCVVHEYSVSLVYLPSTNESSEERFKFSMIDFINPSVLGIVKQPIRGIYIKEEDEDRCELFFLDPIIFMKRNPKQSWSSISTHSGETTDEECIQKSLNISSETDISLNSSILESSSEH